jgi:transposase-like protein
VRSAFAGLRLPADVIVLAIRWYLRFGLSYRDVEDLLAERGVEVDHVTIQHRTPSICICGYCPAASSADTAALTP